MNTFDDILSRMKAAYTGSASTQEGTFAGDLLQAVANELARIYSQELEPVSHQAFVSLASGEGLDAVCGNYGISRLGDESDDLLRARALKQIRQPAGGANGAQYEAWAAAVPGVRRAQSIPLARGAGTVDVCVLPEEGAAATLTADVQQVLDTCRPVGADVQVRAAINCPITVAASAVLEESALPSQVQEAFSAVLRAYLSQVALTPQGRRISVSRLSALLLDCAGVKDVESLTINNRNAGMIPGDGCYASLESLVLTQVAVNG